MLDPAPPEVAVKVERIFTAPLLALLLLVVATVGHGFLTRYPCPDLPGAVRLLGDGDLDGDERQRMLVRVRTLGLTVPGDFAQWAALLACIDLGDAGGHAAALQALGEEPWRHLPTAADRRFLHLGNPLLGNVLAAAVAEALPDRAAARTKWAQVQAQATLMGKPFPRELAAAAIIRLQQ